MSWIIFGYDSDGREISKLSAETPNGTEKALKETLNRNVAHVVVVPTADQRSMQVGTVKTDVRGNAYVEWRSK
jgi:hypothetical protein